MNKQLIVFRGNYSILESLSPDQVPFSELACQSAKAVWPMRRPRLDRSHVLRKRAGVCQDFAHLALACLRSHGIAARYVSGYLATQPPPGKERIVGADASHAWLAVWMPGAAATGAGEWLAIDPTNDQWANERYITVAWGRDYGDVSPVRGVVIGPAVEQTLEVDVDVTRVHADIG